MEPCLSVQLREKVLFLPSNVACCQTRESETVVTFQPRKPFYGIRTSSFETCIEQELSNSKTLILTKAIVSAAGQEQFQLVVSEDQETAV